MWIELISMRWIETSSICVLPETTWMGFFGWLLWWHVRSEIWSDILLVIIDVSSEALLGLPQVSGSNSSQNIL